MLERNNSVQIFSSQLLREGQQMVASMQIYSLVEQAVCRISRRKAFQLDLKDKC